ncbi:MAG: tetratricopeptide repeat protein [Bacteroidales bacterium]|nr:tetratricopeptide repeat protein [Bacteroidales bacterium]
MKYLLLILITTVFFISCESTSEKTKALTLQGISAYQANDEEAASGFFTKAIRVDSTNYEALYYLGLIDFNKKSYENAVEKLQQVIKINPSYGEAYRNLGKIYFVIGDRANSCRYYKLAEQHGIKNLSNQLKGCP